MRRLIDIAVSSFALVVFAPVMAVVAVVVRVRLGRPVVFRQVRPGLGGEPFVIFKFRTMRDAFDEDGNPLPDHERITRLGTFLRSSSLDELPELVNVLQGDMTLVGPRPLRMQYLERYTPRQARRHEVKPGVTGLAQVSGRNALSWEDKFELDVYYVEHRSLALDLRILARTFAQLLRVRQTSAEGHVSAPEFLGSSEATST